MVAFTLTIFHLWIIFGAALALFAITSLILIYHWWRYRMDNNGVIVAGTVYLAVSALIITLALAVLLAHFK